MHIELDDQLVAQVDEVAGHRGRSAFVRTAIERAIREEARWADLELAAGSLPDEGHEWDADPAGWVHRRRRDDSRRGG